MFAFFVFWSNFFPIYFMVIKIMPSRAGINHILLCILYTYKVARYGATVINCSVA